MCAVTATEEEIPILNIYYMLAYAFRTLREGAYARLGAEPFEHIADLFAQIFILGLRAILTQGLVKEYFPRTAALASVRGNIDIPVTMHERTACRHRVGCSFAEFGANSVCNQILKTVARRLACDDHVQDKLRRELHLLVMRMSNVDMCDLRRVRWQSLSLRRASLHYKTLLNICRFFLENRLPSNINKKWKFLNFDDEQHLCRLYEKFLLGYFQCEYPGLTTESSTIKWCVDDAADTSLLPYMYTDVTLKNTATDHALIIDAKYYKNITQKNAYGKEKFHAGNLYQLFSYLKNYTAAQKVSGMLLYAKTKNTEIQDVSWTICGNAVHVKTLNLAMDFKDIQKELHAIAEIV